MTHSATPSGPAGFASLGLSEPSLLALARAGYELPTPIQAQTIPHALAGKDVIGCAATGTGKTAAFMLPIVEKLSNPKERGVKALVLAPTRELALQIAEHAARFGRPHHVEVVTLIGGMGMGAQIDGLKRAQVVIATPGRLIDHLQQGSASLTGVEVLVLDEADRMLDMGFKPQLTRILARLPKKRQTLLFSATMAGEVADFARTNSHDPVRVEVARSGTTASRATQSCYEVGQNEKTALLLSLLAAGDESTLVFTRTKRRADKLTKALARGGHEVERIHADRSQAQRKHALDGFKSGKYRVLVATDIAARGIDVADIGHVVNFDLPHVAEDYIHRVGRTARASASGKASAFCAPEEIDLLRAIEKLTRVTLPRGEVPRETEAFKAEHARAEEGRKHQGVPPHRRPGGEGPSRRPPERRFGKRGGHGGGGHGAPRDAGSGEGSSASAAHRPAGGGHGAAHAAGAKPTLLGSWKPPRKR
jgi:ATP-dependent RNA helicase RhlE